jgi:hypothetical protein
MMGMTKRELMEELQFFDDEDLVMVSTADIDDSYEAVLVTEVEEIGAQFEKDGSVCRCCLLRTRSG